MRRHIERLKQQHPAVRSRVSLMIATSVTAVIALIWLTTLPVRFANTMSSTNGTESTASAISAFGEAIAPDVNTIKGAFSAGTPTGVAGVTVVPNPTDGSSAPNDTSPSYSGSAPSSYLPAGEESNGSASADTTYTNGN